MYVCQRWRCVIFGSPNRLNLQLVCTEESPVRTFLDVWPPFPLVIQFYNDHCWSEWDDPTEYRPDNLVAALGHCDRVCQIDIINAAGFLWERIVTAMEEPFPALKYLRLDLIAVSDDSNLPFPYTFLNGSAPCLQDIYLSGISFSSLPRLLSSTSDLTSLHLLDIPKSGYISPVTMARCLSALPKLKSLAITFRFPTPYPKRRNRPLPPSTRSVPPRSHFFRLSRCQRVFGSHRGPN